MSDDYWGRDNLGQTILDALAAAGKNLDALTIDDPATMRAHLRECIEWMTAHHARPPG